MEININNNQYQTQFDEIKSIIDTRRKRAYKAINNENLTYQELRRQIDACIYERSLLGNTKQSLVLKETYPNARRIFKDSYMVDFLNLPDNHDEKSLQRGLVREMNINVS